MEELVYQVKYVPQVGGYVVIGDRPNHIIYRGDQPDCEDFAFALNFARMLRTKKPEPKEAVAEVLA